MSHLPEDLFYTETHEWLRNEGNGVYSVGITDHAQGMLGDIVFIDLPDTDMDVSMGDDVAVIESVKTAADVYSPVNGSIVEINDTLTASPETVNRDPYGDGWLFKMKLSKESELEGLLSAGDYHATIEEE